MSNRVEINEMQQAMLAPMVQRRDEAQAQLDFVVGLILAGAGVDPRTPVVALEQGALILDVAQGPELYEGDEPPADEETDG
jgi:hypothetical protein